MTIIHTFLYDQSFLDLTSVLDPIRRSGGMCVMSPQSLSYFVAPQEFVDPRSSRASNLNAALTTKPRLIVDLNEYPTALSAIETIWSPTERQNIFAIIDQLCFAYNTSATTEQVELALAEWPQYLTASFVYSNTHTTAPVYLPSQIVNITCPNYVTFTFVIADGTHYQIRVWLNNTTFYAHYPLSTIRTVVPPLALTDLYTLSITTSTANVFTTALQVSQTSQQDLQSYIQSAEYSGYIAHLVPFVDGSGNSTPVEFNLLYNGCVPNSIAIRTAIRELLVNSGVGTSDGWKAIAPSLFVTELFYLLPMWEATTSLISSRIYHNIIPFDKALSDATTALSDIPSGFISTNIDFIPVPYNNMTVLSVPDSENETLRLSLLTEHPTYQNVATTSISFATMAIKTQQFAALLGAALSYAAGNPLIVNPGLMSYTPPNDTRTYITFTVDDVEYYVMTEITYLSLVS